MTTLIDQHVESLAAHPDDRQPQILCVMRMPPDPNGHGGSQRMWHLVEALRPHGRLHFVLVFRDVDADCLSTSLASLEPLVESVTRINIAGWNPNRRKLLGVLHPDFANILRMRSQEAPRLSRRELSAVASQLPIRDPDMVFAGRLCSAVIVQALIDKGFLSAPLRLVDYDDIMSKYRRRQIRNEGGIMGRQWRALAPLDARFIAQAEQRIARSWHGVSVCTDEDVASLRQSNPGTAISKIPNVLDRQLLPPRPRDGQFAVLFVGNLGFGPNVSGLQTFIEQAWPGLLVTVPGITLTIVGFNPPPAIIALAERHGFALHANVPSLQPFYEQCDVVIVPILFGSGTRIKILEAMAYGRPVVSTSMGAEGMGLEGGQQLLLADTMDEFAAALVSLARDPDLAEALAEQARTYQQMNYRPEAIHAAIAAMITRGRLLADAPNGHAS